MPDPGSAPFHRPLADFRDRFGAVGVGAATITSSGDVVVDAFGSRRYGSPDRVTVDDQWHIGSCAKSITAALYGRLVECGAAEWGVPIAECFPDLAGDLAPEWAGPTVDEVLVCRSGMQADLPGSEMAQAWTDESPLVDQRSHATRFALSRPPARSGSLSILQPQLHRRRGRHRPARRHVLRGRPTKASARPARCSIARLRPTARYLGTQTEAATRQRLSRSGRAGRS